MRFEMSYNQAMIIQRAQMAYYRQMIGRKGVKTIRSRTKPPVGLNPDDMMPISIINTMVPRGGDFEQQIRHWPTVCDPTQSAMHDAIRRGLL